MPNNYVEIRVWPKQEISSNPKSWLTLGHVALRVHFEGKEQYISFWPGTCHTTYNQSQNVCDKSKPHFHSIDEDDLLYRKPPSFKHKLYSLDIKAIQCEFEKFQPQCFWHLLGSSFINWDEKIKNCAGLVYHLLEIGGINRLVGQLSLTRLKIGAKLWAPSGRKVGFFTLLFTPFISHQIPRLFSAFSKAVESKETLDKEVKTFQDTSSKLVESLRQLCYTTLNEPRGVCSVDRADNPCSEAIECLEQLPNRIDNANSACQSSFQKCFSEFNSLTSYLPSFIRRFFADSYWLFTAIEDYITPVGLGICVGFTLLAMSYVAFAGLGATAKFAVVTPEDIANLARIAEEFEKKTPYAQEQTLRS